MKITQGLDNIYIDMEFQNNGYTAIKQHEDENGSFSFGPDNIVHVNSTFFNVNLPQRNVNLITKDKEFYQSLESSPQYWHELFENYLFNKLIQYGKVREFMRIILETKYKRGFSDGQEEIQSKFRELMGSP